MWAGLCFWRGFRWNDAGEVSLWGISLNDHHLTAPAPPPDPEAEAEAEAEEILTALNIPTGHQNCATRTKTPRWSRLSHVPGVDR